MEIPQPEPITAKEHRDRLQRATSIATRLGFFGRVEYHHVNSTAGGAQYGIGPTEDQDLLAVYADAFQRDANPEDFSMEAILAHERGHQIICRNPRLKLLAGKTTLATEEILASVIASLLVEDPEDSESLLLKALGEAVQYVKPTDGVRLVSELRCYLEKFL